MSKRIFDVVLASVALLLLWPVLAIVAIAVKLQDGGPVLYCGRRMGRFGKPFFMAKFRTMAVNAESMGASSTADDDPRITRVGQVLRRFKLDELPQLLNVLGGSMSFVGPRPQVAWAVEQYTPEERRLLDVRPGITDYASLAFRNEGEILRGSKDPDKDYLEKIAPGKVRLGLAYVHTHSVWADCRIIAATALAILGVNPLSCFPQFAREALEPQRRADAA